MTYCKLSADGYAWEDFDATVAISAIEESFSVLDGENAGRVMTGRMIRDIIGTYVQHKVTFFNGKSQAGFDALWDWLLEHTKQPSIWVDLADGQRSIKYEAYYSASKRSLKSAADGVNVWDEIEVTFIPMEAQVVPE